MKTRYFGDGLQKKMRRLSAFSVLMIGLAVLSGGTVLADFAPDGENRASTSGPNLYYTVSQSAYTSAVRTEVGIYYTANDIDAAKALAARDTISIIRPNDGSQACTASLGISVTVGSNAAKNEGNSCKAYKDYGSSVPVYDPGTAMFKYKVIIQRTAGDGYINFRVNSKYGQVRAIASGKMSYQSSFPRDPAYYTDYQLKFGSDCSVPAAGISKLITLYDPDNFGSAGNGGAQRRPYSVYVMSTPIDDSSPARALPRSYYTELNNMVFASDSANPGLSPVAASKQNSSFKIKMYPGMRYWFYINDLDNNNTIQVTLPTDEIYHDVPCEWWHNVQTGVAVNTGDPSHWVTYDDESLSSADAVGDRIYFGHKIINGSRIRTPYTLLVSKQQWWTSTLPSATQVTSTAPGNWNPKGIMLQNAVFPNRAWGQSYYYMTSNSVNTGNLQGNPYKLTATDIANKTGQYLCERVATYPIAGNFIASTQQKWMFSVPACVKVEYNYEARPSVNVTDSRVSIGGTVSGITGSVNVASTKITPKGRELATAVVRFVVPKGVEPAKVSTGQRTLGNNDNYACTIASLVYSGRIRDCTKSPDLYWQGGGRQFSPSRTDLITNKTDNISTLNLQVGDNICYMTVVNRYNMDASTTDWRYSATDCVTVSVAPLVQVWGNDTRVGSSFAGSIPRNASVKGMVGVYQGHTRGSWGEYGVLAPVSTNNTPTVATFASGAGYAANGGNLKSLTFANSSGIALGNFARPDLMGTIPEVSRYIDTNKDKVGRANVEIDRSHSSAIANYEANKVIILRGTATITSDLRAPVSAQGYKDVSQMVIIADSIKINSGVTNVDAWLIATKGDIDTCSDKPVRLAAQTCDKLLRVNGPLMASGKVLPRRTGSDNTGSPAEIYNLRGDAYLWAYRVSEAIGTLKTVSTKELPPRF